MNLELLNHNHFGLIFDLLQDVKFPTLPPTASAALPFFKAATHLGSFQAEKLIFWLGLIKAEGKYFVDIAVAKKLQGRWATKTNIINFLQILFLFSNFQPLYTEPRNKNALRLCQAIGFIKKGNYFVLQPKILKGEKS